jgi:NAD kinase
VLQCDAIKLFDAGKLQSLMCDKISKVMNENFTIADSLYTTLKENDYEVEITDDILTEEKDTEFKDLVISVGGDCTYLDSASKIEGKSNTAILGINSVAEYEKGKLCE